MAGSHPLFVGQALSEGWVWAAQALEQLQRRAIWGNPLSHWLLAIAVALVGYAGLRLAASLIGRRARAFAERQQLDWLAALAEMVAHVRRWFLAIIALYLGSHWLVFPPAVPPALPQTIALIAILAQAGLWGNALVVLGVRRYVQRRLETDPAAVTAITALGFLARIVLWVLVAMLVLEQFGVRITALVAGLGVGGIAVALAAQNILGDLFASMSIVLDKPFVLGDFIVVGDKMGTVENIGLKTTRLRALSGEQLVFANNDLLSSRIHNFKRMAERRVVFTVRVAYQTPPEKLVGVPPMLRQAVEENRSTRFDRAHFKQLADSALIFEVVYFVLSADYNLYMDIQQQINLRILEQFQREGIAFAYPTQSVYLAGEGGR